MAAFAAMIAALLNACKVCESGAALDKYRHIIFEDGTLRAFNGVVQFEAPSFQAVTENFAVNEMKLAAALRACDGAEVLAISLTKDFLVFKADRLKVRVRKLDSETVFHGRARRPAKKALQPAGNLFEALQAVNPFMSADATRPWSVSVLLRDGYAWATNNLSIARCKLTQPLEARIPAPAVALLCELPKIDTFCADSGRLAFTCDDQFICCPETEGEWPDVSKFFSKRPAKLPPLDGELLAAMKTVEKFADRFVTLTDASIEGKSATIESEYEVATKRGKGIYSARLLALVLQHATHADFGYYPDPVPFANEILEGVAVGVRPSEAKVAAA